MTLSAPGGLVGPVYRIRTVLAGDPFSILDARHRVVMAEHGVVVFESLFDTMGNHRPGGVQLDIHPVKIIGPHPSLRAGFDLCAIANRITRG